MNKPIYTNLKTGKHYTFDGEQIFTVFISDSEWEKHPEKIDCKGRPYKVFDVECVTTKNGYQVCVLNRN